MNGILAWGNCGLIKLLAIPLGCQKTATKSLVMSPFPCRLLRVKS